MDKLLYKIFRINLSIIVIILSINMDNLDINMEIINTAIININMGTNMDKVSYLSYSL